MFVKTVNIVSLTYCQQMQILYRYPIHSFIVCLNETNKTNIDNLIRGVVLTETAQLVYLISLKAVV